MLDKILPLLTEVYMRLNKRDSKCSYIYIPTFLSSVSHLCLADLALNSARFLLRGDEVKGAAKEESNQKIDRTNHMINFYYN